MNTNLSCPKIMQFFDKNLLQTPISAFRETSQNLWDMYVYIEAKLMPKTAYCKKKLEKCIEMRNRFLELYERCKEKEEELKEKTSHPTQRPFYSIGSTNPKMRRFLNRLEQKRARQGFFLRIGSDYDI